MEKLNLVWGEMVTIRNTGSELDGERVTVVGVGSRHIIDIYIVQFGGEVRTMPDGTGYSCATFPESCLVR